MSLISVEKTMLLMLVCVVTEVKIEFEFSCKICWSVRTGFRLYIATACGF